MHTCSVFGEFILGESETKPSKPINHEQPMNWRLSISTTRSDTRTRWRAHSCFRILHIWLLSTRLLSAPKGRSCRKGSGRGWRWRECCMLMLLMCWFKARCKTVVLVTHQLQLLQREEVDLVALVQRGRLAAVAPYKQLMASSASSSDLLSHLEAMENTSHELPFHELPSHELRPLSPPGTIPSSTGQEEGQGGDY